MQRAIIAHRVPFLRAASSVRFSHVMTFSNSESHHRAPRNLIGVQIRALRLKQDPIVTQEDLAARLAVRGVFIDRTAIAKMENNARFIRDYEAVAIAKCLRVPIAALFESCAD